MVVNFLLEKCSRPRFEPGHLQKCVLKSVFLEGVIMDSIGQQVQKAATRGAMTVYIKQKHINANFEAANAAFYEVRLAA